MWTSVWSRSTGYVRNIHAKIMGYTLCYRSVFNVFVYIFVTPLLKLIGQTEDISNATGKLALWMIPQLFAYAMTFPIAKFLQSQSKMMVMAYISAMALALHTFFSWLFMLKLGWGLAGGALVLNLSWWFIVVAQLIYIFSGMCGKACSGLVGLRFIICGLLLGYHSLQRLCFGNNCWKIW